MFLTTPSTQIAQMEHSAEQKSGQSSGIEISLNHIFYWNIGPNQNNFIEVFLVMLFENCTNGSSSEQRGHQSSR